MHFNNFFNLKFLAKKKITQAVTLTEQARQSHGITNYPMMNWYNINGGIQIESVWRLCIDNTNCKWNWKVYYNKLKSKIYHAIRTRYNNPIGNS